MRCDWHSKRFGRYHSSKEPKNVGVDGFLNHFVNMSFGIYFASVLDGQLLLVLLSLLLHSFGPLYCPFRHFFEILMTVLCYLSLILELQSLIPLLLVKVKQHFLFELVCFVVDVDRIVVLI